MQNCLRFPRWPGQDRVRGIAHDLGRRLARIMASPPSKLLPRRWRWSCGHSVDRDTGGFQFA
jgi:hypothetical protein